MSWRAVARLEASRAQQSRALWAVVALFGLVGVAAVVIPALAIGDALSADRALAFLVAPVRLVVGLTALLAGYGAVAGPRSGGQLKLVLGLPVRRSSLVTGAFVGRAAVVLGGLVVGLAAIALAVQVIHGSLPPAFLGLGALLALFGVTITGLAVSLSSASPSRGHAAAAADAAPEVLLDGLPPVVRLRGPVHEAVTRVAAELRAGHGYGSGAELRGFLRADRSFDEVTAAVDEPDIVVDRDEPTAVDLYEYFSAVESR